MLKALNDTTTPAAVIALARKPVNRRAAMAGAVVAVSGIGNDGGPVDPVFAAIDEYRRLNAEWVAAVGKYGNLRLGDPRWPALQAAADAIETVRADAGMALLNTMPTTMAGAFVLLQYAVEHMDESDGEGWFAGELVADENPDAVYHLRDNRHWSYFVMKNAAAYLKGLAS